MLAKIRKRAAIFTRRSAASTVTEYAVIAAIISIAGVVLLTAIGQRANALLDTMNTNFPK